MQSSFGLSIQMSGVPHRHVWSLPWLLLHGVGLRIIAPLQPAAVTLQLGPDFLIRGFSLGIVLLLQPAVVSLQLGPDLGGPEHGRFLSIWNTHMHIRWRSSTWELQPDQACQREAAPQTRLRTEAEDRWRSSSSPKHGPSLLTIRHSCCQGLPLFCYPHRPPAKRSVYKNVRHHSRFPILPTQCPLPMTACSLRKRRNSRHASDMQISLSYHSQENITVS